ncbi:MAG: peptide chain release factor N(5)-glutamine methyltransferase [Fidelibacterota bacterium]|nr:MAG: peptide chain release factor N(5)-glutamine methyltransferase [Candidatus Neomarinimicrobiota bacterium]
MTPPKAGPSPQSSMADAQTATSKRKQWHIIDLIQWGTQYLSDKQISNARLEVEWLLAHQLGTERVDLYVQHDRLLTHDELSGFKAMVQRRTGGEPFQYILGKAPFYGRDFKVTPEVLIPRPESEILIQVLRKGSPPESLLDIGTGSGCLAVTAAMLYSRAEVLAIDVSPAALEIARENARTMGAENVTFGELDILTASPEGTFDAILCNPPYVATDEVSRLQREIREHEPPDAVTDHADGLTFHRRLAEIGPTLLNSGGRLLVEIGGKAQAKPALEILEGAGAHVILHKDLQGDDRVAETHWS